jgi:hypothetical protein
VNNKDVKFCVGEHSAVKYDTVKYDSVKYESVKYDTVKCDTVKCDSYQQNSLLKSVYEIFSMFRKVTIIKDQKSTNEFMYSFDA